MVGVWVVGARVGEGVAAGWLVMGVRVVGARVELGGAADEEEEEEEGGTAGDAVGVLVPRAGQLCASSYDEQCSGNLQW